MYVFCCLTGRRARRVTYFLCAQIIDNVVRDGEVSDPEFRESKAEGVRQLLAAIKADPEVSATTIPTASDKGYDGFAFIYKL